MSSIQLIHPAREITRSLTRGCPNHTDASHRDLFELFQNFSHESALDLSAECQAMIPVERSLVEKAAIKVGLHTMPLYASTKTHARFEAAALVFPLMPLAMRITMSFYCPELSMEEMLATDTSLSSQCVHSVTIFLNSSIESHDPVWQDRNLVRGRYLLEACNSFTGQSDDETRWIGEHSMALAAHVNALEACEKVDRDFCETLLTTPAPLLNGIL